MKVLIELRPAFDGHSGIPQETRLLFRGLSLLSDVEVVGLIQSSNLVAEPGLPDQSKRADAALSNAEKVDRMAKVVISLQQGGFNRVETLRQIVLRLVGPLKVALATMLGGRVGLGHFDPALFRDFIWRSMFAKSLLSDDFELVTSRSFRVLRWPWGLLHRLGVLSAALVRPVYPRLDTKGFDVFLVETPFPGRVVAGTRMVVRYHDSIPLLMPHTIKSRAVHQSAHYNALMSNVRDGAWFACVSEATRQDLLSVIPSVAERAVTIPNMLSEHYFDEPSTPARVPEIIWSRKNRGAPHRGGAAIVEADLHEQALDYLLIVGTIEPRKNHLSLMDAWEELRAGEFAHLNLVVVGSLGWEHSAIVSRFAPWLERGGLHLLADVPAAELRILYRHARATVCPSYQEGFDFPGVEAMRCGGTVVASDIPVHRAVFGGACEYFSPYSQPALVAGIRAVIGDGSLPRRRELVEEGARVAAQYLPGRVLPQWSDLLRRLAA